MKKIIRLIAILLLSSIFSYCGSNMKCLYNIDYPVDSDEINIDTVEDKRYTNFIDYEKYIDITKSYAQTNQTMSYINIFKENYFHEDCIITGYPENMPTVFREMKDSSSIFTDGKMFYSYGYGIGNTTNTARQNAVNNALQNIKFYIGLQVTVFIQKSENSSAYLSEVNSLIDEDMISKYVKLNNEYYREISNTNKQTSVVEYVILYKFDYYQMAKSIPDGNDFVFYDELSEAYEEVNELIERINEGYEYDLKNNIARNTMSDLMIVMVEFEKAIYANNNIEAGFYYNELMSLLSLTETLGLNGISNEGNNKPVPITNILTENDTEDTTEAASKKEAEVIIENESENTDNSRYIKISDINSLNIDESLYSNKNSFVTCTYSNALKICEILSETNEDYNYRLPENRDEIADSIEDFTWLSNQKYIESSRGITDADNSPNPLPFLYVIAVEED